MEIKRTLKSTQRFIDIRMTSTLFEPLNHEFTKKSKRPVTLSLIMNSKATFFNVMSPSLQVLVDFLSFIGFFGKNSFFIPLN